MLDRAFYCVDLKAHIDPLGYLSIGLLMLKEICRSSADKSSISTSTKRPHVSLTMTHGLSTHRAAANVSPTSPILNPELPFFSYHQQHSHHTRGRASPLRLPRSPEILQRCDPRQHSRRRQNKCERYWRLERVRDCRARCPSRLRSLAQGNAAKSIAQCFQARQYTAQRPESRC